LAKNYKSGIPEILEMCRIPFYRETTGTVQIFEVKNKLAK
jgi:hypothetical protein